jgi:hypothetical protein
MGYACLAAGRFSLLDPNVRVAMAMLVATLLAGAAAIALVARWRRRQENTTFSTHEQLASFRLLYERGEMNAEEYDRVRRRLLGRLKEEQGGTEIAPVVEPAVLPPSTAVTESPPGPLPPGNDVHSADQ